CYDIRVMLEEPDAMAVDAQARSVHHGPGGRNCSLPVGAGRCQCLSAKGFQQLRRSPKAGIRFHAGSHIGHGACPPPAATTVPLQSGYRSKANIEIALWSKLLASGSLLPRNAPPGTQPAQPTPCPAPVTKARLPARPSAISGRPPAVPIR